MDEGRVISCLASEACRWINYVQFCLLDLFPVLVLFVSCVMLHVVFGMGEPVAAGWTGAMDDYTASFGGAVVIEIPRCR